MAFPTQVLLQFNVNALGATPAAIAAAIDKTQIPVDLDIFHFLALRVLSDNTAVVGTQAQRKITCELDQPPFVSTNLNNPQAEPFEGAIRSSSKNDQGNAPAGTGARTIQVLYKDQFGADQTNNLTLDGTTWVPLGTSDHVLIKDIAILSAGADQANDGILEIRTGQDGQGVVVGQTPASFYTFFTPLGQVQQDLVRNLMTLKIQAATGLPVVPVDPVFS